MSLLLLSFERKNKAVASFSDRPPELRVTPNSLYQHGPHSSEAGIKSSSKELDIYHKWSVTAHTSLRKKSQDHPEYCKGAIL